MSRREEATELVHSIADPTVFTLYETVCGGLAGQFAELDELPGVGAARAPG